MAAAIETPTDQQKLLGALVRQRRVALGYTQAEAAKACDLSGQTYWNVEHGRPVSSTTYTKVEVGFTLRAGSCVAVLKGADSVITLDGIELTDEGQIMRPSLERQTEDVRAAVDIAARLTVPGITLEQADAMTHALVEQLQKRGILPTAS